MEFLNQITRFFDPLSILIVFGGAAIVAAVRSSGEDIAHAFAALGPLFSADPEADAQAAMLAVGRIEELAQLRSIACADRVRTAEPFLRRAARRLSDVPSAEIFARWSRDELDARAHRHRGAIAVWRAAADSAPGMGMIGTVIGLIQMFANMDDPAKIGPGMAIALLTTLYGIAIASVIAGPIASRLERLSDTELAWQAKAMERLGLLARAELEAAPARPQFRQAS